jgi:hypothetical protein
MSMHCRCSTTGWSSPTWSGRWCAWSADCIAIELPSTLERPFLRGIARLPEISVLSYEVSSASILKGKTAGESLSTVYLIIDLTDAEISVVKGKERSVSQ